MSTRSLIGVQTRETCQVQSRVCESDSLDAASSSGTISKKCRSGRQFDAMDMVFIGSLITCLSCDYRTCDLNRLFRLDIPKCTHVFSKFVPWARHDARGLPEGRLCAICVAVVQRSYKREGGRKFLPKARTTHKSEFKAAVESYYRQGETGQLVAYAPSVCDSAVVVSHLACSQIERTYDFVPEDMLDPNVEYPSTTIEETIDEHGQMLRGKWIVATDAVPRPRVLRVVKRYGDQVAHDKKVDHSSLSLRESQLEEHFVAAKAVVIQKAGARSDERTWKKAKRARGSDDMDEEEDEFIPGYQVHHKMPDSAEKTFDQKVLNDEPIRDKSVDKGSTSSTATGCASPSKIVTSTASAGAQSVKGSNKSDKVARRSTLQALPPSKMRRTISSMSLRLEQSEQLLSKLSDHAEVMKVKPPVVQACIKAIDKAMEGEERMCLGPSDLVATASSTAQKLKSAKRQLECAVKFLTSVCAESGACATFSYLLHSCLDMRSIIWGFTISVPIVNCLATRRFEENCQDGVFEFTELAQTMSCDKTDGGISFADVPKSEESDELIEKAQDEFLKNALFLCKESFSSTQTLETTQAYVMFSRLHQALSVVTLQGGPSMDIKFLGLIFLDDMSTSSTQKEKFTEASEHFHKKTDKICEGLGIYRFRYSLALQARCFYQGRVRGRTQHLEGQMADRPDGSLRVGYLYVF